MDKIIRQLSQHIDKLEGKAAETLKRLNESLKIQFIWADAFKYHGPVTFTHTKKMLPAPSRDWAFSSARFQRDDGEIHDLTREELAAYKPDAAIHPDYL